MQHDDFRDIPRIKRTEYFAKEASYWLQYLIFVSLSLILLAKGFFEVWQTLDFYIPACIKSFDFINNLLHINTLVYVSYALALSCGIQLAYMLVTHGPDEAVEPVMLGIASAILLILSDTKAYWDVERALVVCLLIAGMAGLYGLSRWMNKKTPPQE